MTSLRVTMADPGDWGPLHHQIGEIAEAWKSGKLSTKAELHIAIMHCVDNLRFTRNVDPVIESIRDGFDCQHVGGLDPSPTSDA